GRVRRSHRRIPHGLSGQGSLQRNDRFIADHRLATPAQLPVLVRQRDEIQEVLRPTGLTFSTRLKPLAIAATGPTAPGSGQRRPVSEVRAAYRPPHYPMHCANSPLTVCWDLEDGYELVAVDLGFGDVGFDDGFVCATHPPGRFSEIESMWS